MPDNQTPSEDAAADLDNDRSALASYRESMRQIREALGMECAPWPEVIARIRHLAG